MCALWLVPARNGGDGVIELRPYQINLIRDVDAALDEHRAVIAVLPTGGGKTVCFASMAAAIARQGASVWALAHREELVDQMSATFLNFDVPHGLIKSGMPLSVSNVQAGMIQTTKNKIGRMKPPDVLVIDECHHTPASQYDHIISQMPAETKIIGFTATPCRLDGKGLGKYFSKMILGPTIAELISLGFLVPPRLYNPKLVDTGDLHARMGDFVRAEAEALMDKPTITGDCVDHYNKLAGGTQAVAFCVSVAHAEHVATQFNATGIPAAHIDGGMAKHQRRQILDRFREREIRVLTSADLISEGFDCPGIETAILLRPTKSESLYLQQVGRALRTAPGKKRAIIIDHVDNVRLHGQPTDERDWSLEGITKRKRDADIEIRTCKVCFLVYTGKQCPECKVEELRTGREIEYREGELVEYEVERSYVTPDELAEAKQCGHKLALEQFALEKRIRFATVRDALIRDARTLDGLKVVGRLLGYANGWAAHRFDARRSHGSRNDDQMRMAL